MAVLGWTLIGIALAFGLALVLFIVGVAGITLLFWLDGRQVPPPAADTPREPEPIWDEPLL